MAEPVHAGAPLQPVDADQLPDWMANTGTRFGVIGDAWKVTANPAIDRGIRFTPGRGWSDGILTDFDETNIPASFGLPADTAARYYMIVSRVNWQDPFTRTFVAIPAGSTRALPVNSLDYKREPGVIADFPVALVQVPGNSTQLGEIVDLRVWRGDCGPLLANSDLVMQYLDRPGTEVVINDVLWRLRWNSGGVLEWVDVGKLDDTGWVDIILQNGWSIPDARYKPQVRRKNGEVKARGRIIKTSAVTFQDAFVLPEWARPTIDQQFPITSNTEASFFVEVRRNGFGFMYQSGASAAYRSLDAVSFFND